MVLVFFFLFWYSSDAAMVFLIYLLAWAAYFGTLGAIIAYFKRAPGIGAMLGGLFGPLGVVAAFAVDNRPSCSNCSGRLEDGAETCPHCHVALYDPLTEPEPQPLREEGGELRTWTDSGSQYTMNGRFVRQLGDVATLRYEDGSEVDVPMERLSRQDREWIRNAQRCTEPEDDVLAAIVVDE
jgi:hypothetical protein